MSKEDVIRDSMLLPVRAKSGLGSPPDHFYTNSSECINNVLKVKVNYKVTELTLFMDKIHQLVEEQQRECEKAVIGCGKYVMLDQYQYLQISEREWFTMTKEKRLQWLMKYNDTSVSPLACEPRSVFPTLSETDDHMLLTASQQNQIKVSSISQPDQVVTLASSSQPQQAKRFSEKLSVLSTALGCEPDQVVTPASTSQPQQAKRLSEKLSVLSTSLGLPVSAIDGIAKKAAEIICTEDGIVHAPRHPRMVISQSSKRPHLVLPKQKSAGMQCEDCPRYKSAKLCSHVVAAACVLTR